jgi:hypothetical protein
MEAKIFWHALQVIHPKIFFLLQRIGWRTENARIAFLFFLGPVEYAAPKYFRACSRCSAQNYFVLCARDECQGRDHTAGVVTLTPIKTPDFIGVTNVTDSAPLP